MAEITLTQENFEDEVINSDIPVLVDFWVPEATDPFGI